MCKKIDPAQKSTIGTLRTKEENSKIQTNFPGNTWIGGFEVGSSGQWFWWGSYKQNAKITTTFWSAGEPNNDKGNNEACLMYTSNQPANGWNDSTCYSKYNALCEIRCD